MAKKICIFEGLYTVVAAAICLIHLTIGKSHIPQSIKALMAICSTIGIMILFVHLKKKDIEIQQYLLTIVPVISINFLMLNT